MKDILRLCLWPLKIILLCCAASYVFHYIVWAKQLIIDEQNFTKFALITCAFFLMYFFYRTLKKYLMRLYTVCSLLRFRHIPSFVADQRVHELSLVVPSFFISAAALALAISAFITGYYNHLNLFLPIETPALVILTLLTINFKGAVSPYITNPRLTYVHVKQKDKASAINFASFLATLFSGGLTLTYFYTNILR